MARKNNREEDKVESLEIQVRELKSENRQLHKRLKKLSRGYYKYLEEDVHEEPEPIKKEEKRICFDCTRGEMVLHIILNRRFRECNVCGRRTKTKIIEK